jgi:hypothetical protein
MKDTKSLTTFYIRKFTLDNFFLVCYWMVDILDLAGSSELGKYYARNIFANLLMRTKLYLDWEEGGQHGFANSRSDLLQFVDLMATPEEYANIGKEDFKEITSIFMRGKKRKAKDKTLNLPKNGNRLHISSDRPPKTATPESLD